jgi:hypothetical protein
MRRHAFARNLRMRAASRPARGLRYSDPMKPIVRFAQLLSIVTLLAAPVASIAGDSPRSCDRAAATAEYDRKADEYEAAAGRYRAWARAENVLSTDRYGSGWDFAQQADRLDAAAAKSRARAAESRSREDSNAASAENCRVETSAAGVDG